MSAGHTASIRSLFLRPTPLGQLPHAPLAGRLVVRAPVGAAIELAAAAGALFDDGAAALGAGDAGDGDRSRVAALGKGAAADELAAATATVE